MNNSANKYKIHVIIPARSGSKGVIDKNIKHFKNKPLLFHTFDTIKQSKYFNNLDIYLSTDSKKYIELVKNNNYTFIKCDYLRPQKISDDLSVDYDFCKFHIEWLSNNDIALPNFIIQLRPTTPSRNINICDKAIDAFISNINEYDSLRSVIKVEKSPYKMYTIESKDDSNLNKQYIILNPLFNTYKGYNEPYNLPRQLLPDCYLHNGYIDIIKTDTIINLKSVTGCNILPFIMEDTLEDIDTLHDFENANNTIH